MCEWRGPGEKSEVLVGGDATATERSFVDVVPSLFLACERTGNARTRAHYYGWYFNQT